MSIRTRKMNRAVNELSKYFGLSSIEDLITAAANQERTAAAVGGSATDVESIGTLEDFNRIIGTLTREIIDTSEGCSLTYEIIRRINQLTSDATDEQKEAIKRYIEIYYGPKDDPNYFLQILTNFSEYASIVGPIGTEGGSTRGILNSETINQNLGLPTKSNPGLSVIISNSARISPVIRNTNAVCVFMNGVPTIEFARALPYAEIKFFLPRPPISTASNRVQGLSLIKFLLGAETVSEGSVTQRMLSANSITGSFASQFPQSDEYTIAGMELFTSPQTLVNANETDNEQLRANPVLDKFRPFMTVKELSIEVRPSTGLASFKTANLSMVLHDRSRMNDVADFVKADLYSGNEIEIEYGWVHPDEFITTNTSPNNFYGDLLNGMKVKERYGIINSSFTLAEGGAVDIKLELAMRGGSDLSTELVSTGIDTESVGNSIRQLRELQNTISELRNRVFDSNQTGARTREIRGVQALDAAMTANPTFRLTRELRTELTTLQNNLRAGEDNPANQALLAALERFYRNGTTTSGDENQPDVLEEISDRIIDSIQRKVNLMTQTQPDPFKRDTGAPGPTGGSRSARVSVENTRELNDYKNRFTNSGAPTGETTLATMLLHFVGEPLAATGKFDEIQFLFYPFNSKAGYARRISTASFIIDLAFFSQELSRNRLEAANNSVNMTIREFFNFLQSIIIDDPAAPSYGLWDGNALYREVVEDGARRIEAVDEVPEMQARMDRILRDVTSDGTFQMPQIEIMIECLPSRLGTVEGEEIDETTAKSVLRIHVFDRVATCYESQGQILRATRDDAIAMLGRSNTIREPDEDTISPIEALQEEDARVNLQRALDLGLLEIITPSGNLTNLPPGDIRTYLNDQNIIRVAGGSRALKEFLYKTVPYIIYGIQGTAVKQANLSSQQNTQLSTVNMLRSPRSTQLQPNGEQPGGLPMQVIPAELTLTTLGCPIVNYTQQFFIDFQTGTSLDNIYGVTGITHKISPGNFTTDLKLAPFDAYGQYYNLMSNVRNQITVVERAIEQREEADSE